MSIRNALSLTLLALALSACGGGNDQTQANMYGQNAVPAPGPQPGNLCPPQTAKMWNHMVASRCNNVQSEEQARWCAWGAVEFRDRNQMVLQGAGCAIAVRETQWCPGEGWNRQQFFQLNFPIVQSILDRFGGAATPTWPVNQPGPGPGPGPRPGHM